MYRNGNGDYIFIFLIPNANFEKKSTPGRGFCLTRSLTLSDVGLQLFFVRRLVADNQCLVLINKKKCLNPDCFVC